MSQAYHETIDVPSGENGTDKLLPLLYPRHSNFLTAPSAQIGDDQYLSRPQNQVLSDFVDGSGPIFSMYLEMATEDDKKMVEDWKADADGILIFVRLSSNLGVFTSTQLL